MRALLPLAMVCALSGIGLADETDKARPAIGTPVEEFQTAREREREYAAFAGLLAIAGIAITGVALLAGVVLWAGRLRRRNRRKLPETPLQDEFWFLKTGRRSPGDASYNEEAKPTDRSDENDLSDG